MRELQTVQWDLDPTQSATQSNLCIQDSRLGFSAELYSILVPNTRGTESQSALLQLKTQRDNCPHIKYVNFTNFINGF